MDASKFNRAVKKLRDTYDIKPGAPVVMQEFGFFTLDNWVAEGHIKNHGELAAICGFDGGGLHYIGNTGGCDAPFIPSFNVEILEDRGVHEVVRDSAGRHVLYFKGRRDGFMPEYLDHPVKDMKTWEEQCKWRLDPHTPARLERIKKAAENAKGPMENGYVIAQYIVGGYMYLRSLIGPTELLYKFYDEPELIHDCMKTWLAVMDFSMAEYQKTITYDEILLDEDICYNHGSLISPAMIEEFILPYYQELHNNIRRRQIDKSRKLHIHLATDGYSDCVIPLYEKVGMDHLSPFEVASGSDVVETGRKNPGLIISGGMDKRVLAKTKDDIDRMVDRIMPAMKARGGYIPTCDHGVPEEVPFENYVHFRKRLLEYS